MMLNSDLCNPKASRGSENGDESMHFSVKRDLVQNVAAVSLKTAIEIVQLESSRLAKNSIKYK